MRWLPLTLCLVLVLAAPAAAQDDNVIARARQAAAAGNYAAALKLLEARLALAPTDVDARLVFGLVLSWDKRYEDTRRELQQVLQQTPDYADARIALMNVEWWSGHNSEARAAADAILARDPGQPQARLVRNRLDATALPWEAGVAYAFDTFSDDRPAWHEGAVSLSRRTAIGPAIVRLSTAERFSQHDRQLEAEFYPQIRAGTYGYVGVGWSDEAVFYPSVRISADLYQSVGGGVEISVGFRRLSFDTAVNIYVGTLTKYAGNWMVIGRVFHVPGAAIDSTSYHGGVRRYVRADGVSYVGANYGHGFARD